MKRAFLAYLALVLGAYGTATWSGWEMGGGRRGLVPPSVRQSPGGYRSYGYWRGGK